MREPARQIYGGIVFTAEKLKCKGPGAGMHLQSRHSQEAGRLEWSEPGEESNEGKSSMRGRVAATLQTLSLQSEKMQNEEQAVT